MEITAFGKSYVFMAEFGNRRTWNWFTIICLVTFIALSLSLHHAVKTAIPSYLASKSIASTYGRGNLTMPLLSRMSLNSCVSLLSEGYFTGHGLNSEFHPNNCTAHNYTTGDVEACFGSTSRIAFMGDSRVCQLYDYFMKYIRKINRKVKKFHHDEIIYAEKLRLTVNFFWKPRMDREAIDVLAKWLETDSRPEYLFIGIGLWDLRESNGSYEGEQRYNRNLTLAVNYMQKLTKDMQIIWIPQDPINESIRDKRRMSLTNHRVDRYNEIAENIINNSNIQIWRTSRITAKHFKDFYRDCVHIHSHFVDFYKSQILLNWFCSIGAGGNR